MTDNSRNDCEGVLVDFSVATRPMDLAAIPKLLSELTAGVESLKSGMDDELRQELSTKARDIMLALETPRELSMRHIWGDTGAIGAISWGVDIGLWKLMVRHGDRPQTVADLASELGADPTLLGRLLRHLGAMGYLKETGADEYMPTNFSKALALDMIGDAYIAIPSATGAAQLKYHEFSRKQNWQRNADAEKTPLHYAYKTDLHFFPWLESQGYDKHFNNHMRGYRLGRLPWMHPNVFPVKERLVDGADTSADASFLVDIGGSVGHDLEEFRRYYPDTPGKLVLQDLPVVISKLNGLDPAITPMEYDFLHEQPLKGARAYYMHSVLHDWPDSVCEEILARVKEAMKPGYSKLLINENVIPATGTWWESSALDIMMLACFSAQERTESDWYNLVEKKAGLKIVKIWHAGRGVESLIEVELP